MGKFKRLIWDIETSPNIGYFWRPGYNIRLSAENILKERAIICICYGWEDDPWVHSMAWNNGNDKPMLKEFVKIANEADELVAHNGDRFDLPWFQGRCVKHGFDPLPEYKTVDTLRIARKRFNFNSNRLDYLGKFLLGEGKIHTEFDLWKTVCDGDKKSLDYMVKYCMQDVVLLEKVWKILKPYHKPKTHAGVFNNLARWTCPHDGSKDVITSKTRSTAAGMVRFQMQCKNCGYYFTIPQNVHRAYQEATGNE